MVDYPCWYIVGYFSSHGKFHVVEIFDDEEEAERFRDMHQRPKNKLVLFERMS